MYIFGSVALNCSKAEKNSGVYFLVRLICVGSKSEKNIDVYCLVRLIWVGIVREVLGNCDYEKNTVLQYFISLNLNLWLNSTLGFYDCGWNEMRWDCWADNENWEDDWIRQKKGGMEQAKGEYKSNKTNHKDLFLYFILF